MLALLLALPTFAQKDKDHDFKVAKNMDVFNAIYKNLDMMYVDTLNADEVIGYGIKAMLGSLDPYTTYYPESDQKELKRMLTFLLICLFAYKITHFFVKTAIFCLKICL